MSSPATFPQLAEVLELLAQLVGGAVASRPTAPPPPIAAEPVRVMGAAVAAAPAAISVMDGNQSVRAFMDGANWEGRIIAAPAAVAASGGMAVVAPEAEGGVFVRPAAEEILALLSRSTVNGFFASVDWTGANEPILVGAAPIAAAMTAPASAPAVIAAEPAPPPQRPGKSAKDVFGDFSWE
jgi:hypothetical protein